MIIDDDIKIFHLKASNLLTILFLMHSDDWWLLFWHPKILLFNFGFCPQVSSENNLNHFTLIFLSLKKNRVLLWKKKKTNIFCNNCFARTNKKRKYQEKNCKIYFALCFTLERINISLNKKIDIYRKQDAFYYASTVLVLFLLFHI